MQHIGITHAGKKTNNEDCYGIFPIGENAVLYAVCDGVGGCGGGEIASAIARDSFSDFVRQECGTWTDETWDTIALAQIKRIMRAAATHAGRAVRAAAQQNSELDGMASTLVAALVTRRRAYVLHVGDSRLYTVTGETVEKVTRDHSYLQYLIDIGRITREQAKDLTIENYITRAIGAYDHVDGDFCALDRAAYPSDTYLLLCSDGLYRSVTKPHMQEILTAPIPLARKAEKLVSAALQGGAEDNITAIIVYGGEQTPS